MEKFRSVGKMRTQLYSKLNSLKIPGLLSLSIVGSFQDMKKIDNVTDVDIVVLVENLDVDIFKDISSKFDLLAKDMSSSNEIFFIENRCAAVKSSAMKDKKVVQLHLLLYDKKTWISEKLYPGILDWTYFNTKISGKHLGKIEKIPKQLNKKEVIADMLKRRLPAMKKRIAYGGLFIIKNNKLSRETKQIVLREDEYIESVCQGITISFLNYLRFFDYKIRKDKKLLLAKAKKELPKKHFDLLVDTFSLKERMENGDIVTRGDLSYIRKRGVEFIEYLAKKVSEA